MVLKNIKREYLSGKITKEDYIHKMHAVHQNLFEYTHFIKDTNVSSILISDDNVLMSTRDRSIRFYVDPLDKRNIPIEILNFGNYEKEELDIMAKLLTDVSTVMDIGANIGWYSINLAMIKPDLSINAFEPIPRTYQQLQRNIELNKIKTINTYNFGFSDHDDTIIFYYSPQISGSASAANISEKTSVEEIKCKVTSIDNFIRNSGVGTDFIKCDVEGAELCVFRGAKETIAAYKPIVFTEMLRKWAKRFNYHPNEIITIFEELGYRCFCIRNGLLSEMLKMDETTVETNFFFLHSKKHDKLMCSLCR